MEQHLTTNLFGRVASRGWGAWNALNVEGMPTFVDTEEVEFVYRLISDLREKVRTAKLRS